MVKQIKKTHTQNDHYTQEATIWRICASLPVLKEKADQKATMRVHTCMCMHCIVGCKFDVIDVRCVSMTFALCAL